MGVVHGAELLNARMISSGCGAHYGMGGRSRIGLVHDAECMDALAWRECMVRHARMLSPGGVMHGSSRMEPLHGAASTDALALEWHGAKCKKALEG